MLKFHVKALEEVPEAQRSLYAAVPEAEGGGFRLAVDGLEDTGALKRAKDHEVAARKAAEAKLKEITDAAAAAQEAARKAAEDAAAKSGDIEAYRKSADERLAKAIADKDAEYKPLVQSLTGDVNRLLVDNVATQIASKIAVQGSDALLIPHIRQRLAVDIRDGKRTTVVIDAEGKPSALTLDDLEKEFVGNKAFAPVIVGTKASGGGAGGANGGGAAGAKTITRSDFEALNPQARADAMKTGTTVID